MKVRESSSNYMRQRHDLAGPASRMSNSRAKLNELPEILNPPPLLTGEDLKAAGVPQGPEMARLLKAVRSAQLDRRVVDRDAAIVLMQHLWKTNAQ